MAVWATRERAEAAEAEVARLKSAIRAIRAERRDPPWPQFGVPRDCELAARDAFNMAIDIALEHLEKT